MADCTHGGGGGTSGNEYPSQDKTRQNKTMNGKVMNEYEYGGRFCMWLIGGLLTHVAHAFPMLGQ